MKFNLHYFQYWLCKPFHSTKHKAFKRKTNKFAIRENLYHRAVAEIAEYTKEDVATIELKRKKLGEEIDTIDYNALNEQQLHEFYVSNEHSIYNLPIWNAECGRGQGLLWLIYPYLKRNKYKTILDFGAGAGDMTILLAQEGFKVAYSDINQKVGEFAKWRFARRNLDVHIVDDENLTSHRFDCIVSFDVFEHLKNLPARIQELSTMIADGGSLIFNIEFSGDGLHLAENKIYQSQAKLSQMLQDAYLNFNWKFKDFFFYKKTGG